MKNEIKKFRITWCHVAIAGIITSLLFGLNLWYALGGPSYRRSEVLSVFSGWISGIATIALGLITLYQSWNYEKLSEKFTEKQAATLDNIERLSKTQGDTMWRGQYYSFFNTYEEKLYAFQAFFEKHNANTISEHFLDLGHQITANHLFENTQEENTIKMERIKFEVLMLKDGFYFAGKAELVQLVDDYFDKFIETKREILQTSVSRNHSETKNINQNIDKLHELYKETLSALLKYNASVGCFELCFLDSSVSTEKIEDDLRKMQKQQADYVKSISGKEDI